MKLFMLCFKQQLGSAEVPQFLSTLKTTLLWYIFNEHQNGHQKSRGQDCVTHYQLRNIYNLSPQSVEWY